MVYLIVIFIVFTYIFSSNLLANGSFLDTRFVITLRKQEKSRKGCKPILFLTFPRDYFCFPSQRRRRVTECQRHELLAHKYASPGSAAGIQAASAEVAVEARGTA